MAVARRLIHRVKMRAVLLAAAAAASASAAGPANDSAWQWRERLGLAGSACPAECPLRHRSIVNIKDFGRAGFAEVEQNLLGPVCPVPLTVSEGYSELQHGSLLSNSTTCRGGNATRATARPTARPSRPDDHRAR